MSLECFRPDVEMMALLTESEVEQMVSRLEQQEVDCQTASGTVPLPVYCELLASYLASQPPQLSQAKYLVMRVPPAILESNEGAELNRLWKIGKNLWAGNTEEVFSSLAGPWSENVQRIIEKVSDLRTGDSHRPLTSCVQLGDSLKQTNLRVVGDVYSDINISRLSSMLGLDTEQTIAVATSEGGRFNIELHGTSPPLLAGWAVDTERGLVKPLPLRERNSVNSQSDDTLEKIISFVSYMEN